MPVQFARESVSSVWDEALPLVKANHAETGCLETEDFAPQLNDFDELERAGMLIVFTARDGGFLVGYSAFIIAPKHLHYPRTKWAMQDVLYVAPSHRGITSARFVMWQDKQLTLERVQLVYRHNTFHKDYSRLLLRLGYHAEEVRYVRDLRGVA